MDFDLTYLEKQKCYGPDKKILFKKQGQRKAWHIPSPKN
jgi:hypothetical protein